MKWCFSDDRGTWLGDLKIGLRCSFEASSMPRKLRKAIITTRRICGIIQTIPKRQVESSQSMEIGQIQLLAKPWYATGVIHKYMLYFQRIGAGFHETTRSVTVGVKGLQCASCSSFQFNIFHT